MASFQLQTRGSIRRSIGKNLGILIDGVATSTTDTSSLIDTKNLLGGDDEHNQKEVMIYDAAGTIVDGESSIVSDFAGSTNDATCAPVFSAAITILDKYEMWKNPWRIADINDAINQAIINVTSRALAIKETHTTFTEDDKYLYDVLSGFTHVNKVEYVYTIGTEDLLSDCETAWTAGTSVTATADSSFKKKGTYSAKFVVAAGAASGATLCYLDITLVDISDCTEIELWMYSSVTVTAGQLQFMVGATAAIASPVETIDIPAMTGGKWYRHVISLANPHSDTAIISIGVRQASGVDVGAFTFYLDDIKAVDALTKEYRELSNEYWNISRGATPYLMLNTNGLSLVGDNTQLRLTGYSYPALLSDDTTDSEVDPAYIIAQTTGRLLVSHAKSSYLDIHDRAKLSQYWLGEADRMISGMTPSIDGEGREV